MEIKKEEDWYHFEYQTGIMISIPIDASDEVSEGSLGEMLKSYKEEINFDKSIKIIPTNMTSITTDDSAGDPIFSPFRYRVSDNTLESKSRFNREWTEDEIPKGMEEIIEEIKVLDRENNIKKLLKD